MLSFTQIPVSKGVFTILPCFWTGNFKVLRNVDPPISLAGNGDTVVTSLPFHRVSWFFRSCNVKNFSCSCIATYEQSEFLCTTVHNLFVNVCSNEPKHLTLYCIYCTSRLLKLITFISLSGMFSSSSSTSGLGS